ncbi:RNA-directed DNA polymerase from mobile element jockey [Plakobranchus ocellatus]|uniref:RNA-directed DNA polymerase from mobile element jockey n=1 Tax=Plakobranchus ocellatus TaxID=259542 RepID=A0AAV3ZK60_9GAST|nr:RNA-directed DNA polymerase from mobile element jockey [Plakobranchus ocellatus]
MKGGLSANSLSVEMDTGGLRNRESETVIGDPFFRFLDSSTWTSRSFTIRSEAAQRVQPEKVSKLSLAELFEQLPNPFLVLGDFNAHSPARGDSRQDGRGRMLEMFTAENGFIILNSGKQTFVHSTYPSTSAIDLAVSPSIAAECSWAAHSDLCGSDHFPIFLILTSNFSPSVNTTTFNFQKADWSRFGDLCRLSLDDSVADIEQFTSKLLDAARSSIPFHKGTKCKTRVPWFTQECKRALQTKSVLQERKKVQRKYFKAPSFENFIN